MHSIVVLCSQSPIPSFFVHTRYPDSEYVTPADIRNWAQEKLLLRKFRSFKRVVLLEYDWQLQPCRPLVGGVGHFLGRKVVLEDTMGFSRPYPFSSYLRDLAKHVLELPRIKERLAEISRDLDALEQVLSTHPAPAPDMVAPPFYLRTDLFFGVRAGGCVGHISGVLNNLDKFTASPVFLTSDQMPLVRPELENYIIRARNHAFWTHRDMSTLVYNQDFMAGIDAALSGRKAAFIYQRYGLNNYCGAVFSRRLNVPFILEYNGSEVWVAKNWSAGVRYPALSERIEMLNLRAADLVVVVSEPLRDELIGRGIPGKKILVNPNGVDTDRFSPEFSGEAVRQSLDLAGKTVIGFIGTFGQWHGAEVLAEAFGLLITRRPDLHERVRLLLIGDGLRRRLVEQKLREGGVMDLTLLTGIVPQEQGPEHLAACDILSSPHVSNTDGSKFFGSPTKLFEYMAMGKGIVASDLDQIGEILEHGKTAFLVRPGDAEDLSSALERLVGDEPLTRKLGRAARQKAVQEHSWIEHTRRIVHALLGLKNGTAA